MAYTEETNPDLASQYTYLSANYFRDFKAF